MLINMVKRVGILVLLMTATLSWIATAHGEWLHVFGTITVIDRAQIRVLTIEWEAVSIHTVAECLHPANRHFLN